MYTKLIDDQINQLEAVMDVHEGTPAILVEDALSWLYKVRGQILSNQKYAVMNVLRSWEVFSAQGDDEAQRNGYTVTAKDIEDVPEWVKAIEPVEVND